MRTGASNPSRKMSYIFRCGGRPGWLAFQPHCGEMRGQLKMGGFRVASLVFWGLLAGVVSHAAMIPVPGDPVRTASGLVAGTQLSPGVKAYLGIPYAKPPVNGLRWQAPQPLKWTGVWNADRKGPE